VTLAIDDFGTGYSSLSYLKRLRPDKLKIDRSFVRDLPDDTDDRALTEAIVGIAQALSIAVVAEGVETPAQRDFLRGLGCTLQQGYLLGRPLAADAIAPLLPAIEAAELLEPA
jgi:EAL domain-containing protein (putative c-di-GMP-specific phosphodiesterase class I)